MGGRFAVLFPVSSSVVLLLEPPLVAVFLNLKFDRVVTGGDRGHIPIKLGDLTTLVQHADSDGEKEGDQDSGGYREAHLLVFHLLVLL